METRIQRIRRCRKIALRCGLQGLAQQIETAGLCLRMDNRPASDAMLRVINADHEANRVFLDSWKRRQEERMRNDAMKIAAE